MPKHRTQKIIEYWQDEYIKRMAKKYGISESEAPRRIIDEKVTNNPKYLPEGKIADVDFKARTKAEVSNV